MHGVFLDLRTVDRDDLDLTSLRSVVTQWTCHDWTDPSRLIDRIGDADIVVSNKVRLDAAALASAHRLKLVCIAATGTNNVDLDACHARGITVSNVTGYATPSVVEHVVAQVLNLMRRLNEYRLAIEEGRWQHAGDFCLLDYPIRELKGQTLGIIGYGELGRAVAATAGAFGMNVQVAERRGRPPRPGRIPLDRLLATSHVVSLHCPMTDETRALIGARELGLIRRDAILVNTARGGIVDEAALLEALRGGRIAGAAIDVLAEEPPHHGNPLLETPLPNLLVTPHIAWASINARQRLIDEIAANIRAWLNGTPRNVASPECPPPAPAT
jgi:glycerate dehydrogenase